MCEVPSFFENPKSVFEAGFNDLAGRLFDNGICSVSNERLDSFLTEYFLANRGTFYFADKADHQYLNYIEQCITAVKNIATETDNFWEGIYCVSMMHWTPKAKDKAEETPTFFLN